MAKVPKIDVSIGGYLFTQSILFIVHYGFEKSLPRWVLWFPTWLIIVVALMALIILAVFFAIGVIADKW